MADQNEPSVRGVGRPALYKPEYCEAVIKCLGDGKSLTSFAAEINVARDTIYEWEKVYPEFSDACARARAKSGAWWENLMRRLAVKGEGNPQAILFAIKNMARDDWFEKSAVEVTGKDGGPVQTIDATGLSAAAMREILEAADAATKADNG